MNLLLLLLNDFSQLECWIQLRDVFLDNCLVIFIIVKRI